MFSKEFEGYYDTYAGKIYSYIMRKVGSSELAEDLCSEVWIKALRFFDAHIQDESHFRSWIYVIARNSVIDYYRTQKSQVSFEEIGEIAFHDDMVHELQIKQELQAVQEYMKHFSENEKEIFILRMWDDLAYKEIAEITGKSVDACKKSVSRSMEKLQQFLTQILAFICI